MQKALGRDTVQWGALFLLLVMLFASPTAAAPPTKAAAGPVVVFSAHSVFRGVMHGIGSQGSYTIDLKMGHLSLPTGDYWIFADYLDRSSGSSADASFFLLGLDGAPRKGDGFNGFSYSRFGRFAQRITLASPFDGEVSYGGGSLGAEEIWFRVVAANSDEFLPFAFGTQPLPLKKGTGGVRGTLGVTPSNYFYLQLPKGYWRFTFKATAPTLTSKEPKGYTTGYGAVVDLLDEHGVEVKRGFLSFLFVSGGPYTSGSETVLKVDAPEFVKLHAQEFVMDTIAPNPPRPALPMTYSLTVEPATAAEYQPAAAGS